MPSFISGIFIYGILGLLFGIFGYMFNGGYEKIIAAQSSLNKGQEEFELINNYGTIIITDARGYGRDIALSLAEYGNHVIACVPTEADKQTFIFDTLKGLEPIVMDITEPKDIAAVMYRTKEVINELHRPLMGIVINTLSFSEDLNKNNGKFSRKRALKDKAAPQWVSGLDLNFDMSVAAYEDTFRRFVKTVIRFVDASLHMWDFPHRHSGRIVMLSSFDPTFNIHDERTSLVLPSAFGYNDDNNNEPIKDIEGDCSSSSSSSSGGSSNPMEVVGRNTLQSYVRSLPSSFEKRELNVTVSSVLVAVQELSKSNKDGKNKSCSNEEVHLPDGELKSLLKTEAETEKESKGKGEGKETKKLNEVLSSAVIHSLLADKPRSLYRLGGVQVDWQVNINSLMAIITRLGLPVSLVQGSSTVSVEWIPVLLVAKMILPITFNIS